MREFLQILLYIIIGFWLIRQILKWALPYIFQYFMSFVGKKVQNQFESDFHKSYQPNKENVKKEKYKSNKNKVGEYIDFEEID